MQDISHRGFIVEDLLCGAPSCSEACLFFSNNLLRLWLQSVQYDLQHDFAWQCCRLPFLGSVMTKDWVNGVGHSPVCQILLLIVVTAVITFSPPAWTSSAGMLLTQADFPSFNDCTAASTSRRRMGWSSSATVWGQFSTDGSPLALWLYSSEQYSVHRFSIRRSSVRHFPERSWTVVTFPCFTVVMSFTSWYALLLLFFLRFSSFSLHCSPIRFSLAFFMHLLMLLFTPLYFSDPSG